MRYLFISPGFPPNFKYFVQRLSQRGVDVIGLGSDSYDQLDDALKSALSEYVWVHSLDDYDAVYRSVAALISRRGRLDRLESHNEHWLELDARLRLDFNIEGFKPADMPSVKLKSKMKDVFKKLKLNTPAGATFESEAEAIRLIEKFGYPVIVKPDKGVGASDTHRLDDEADLRTFMARKPAGSFILEPFIDAPMETYDGLVDQNGSLVFENSFLYDSGVMDNVVLGKDMYYVTQRRIPADLKRQGLAIVSALNLRERFFHIEFFRLPSGDLMVLELNARPPGGWSMDMMNIGSSVDLYDAYAQVVLNQPIELLQAKPYHCLYVGVKAHNLATHRHRVDENLERLRDQLILSGSNPSIFGPAIGDVFYLLRDAKLKPLLTSAAQIHAKNEE